MEQREHPPEDVSWVQPAESLAFSASPVASSGSNTHDGGDADRKSFRCGSQDGDGREEEEDPPLMGEFIRADSVAGGMDTLDDERNRAEEVAQQLSVNDNGHESNSSSPSDMIDDRDRGFRDPSPYAQQAPWGQQQQQHQQQQQQQQEQEQREEQYFDDNAIDGAGGARVLLPGEGGNGSHASDNEDLISEASRSGDGARPQLRDYHAVDRLAGPDWHGEDRGEDGEAWADNGYDDNDGRGGEDYAPAWDQGRPAESHDRNVGVDLGGIEQIGRLGLLGAEEAVAAPGLQDRLQNHDTVDVPRFDSAQEEDSSQGIQSGSSSSVSSDNFRALAGSPAAPTRDREESPPSFRVARRRTRRSVDRERRRLDRIPRSQRLSQVKGHPLGGMTLLELEERRLLDVGIGQMARQLAKHRGWRGPNGGGRARQSNEDLLRRSARLLRRAQDKRDARFSVDSKRDFYQSSRSGSAGNPSSRSCRDISNAGARARPQSSTSGRREGGPRGKVRRPASASRGYSRSSMSPSFAPEPADLIARDRGYTTSDNSGPHPTDGWRGTLDGDAPPVGLYSGGGTRCSLKQRRPMSAKPALTCGSGWKPGKLRAGCRRSEDRTNSEVGRGQWDHFDDARGTAFRGGGRVAGGTWGGRGVEDTESDYSDMSDLSPQGIVDYNDDEEGPFNVDELERVAASYLLRPRGSTCFPSAAADDEDNEDDNRFADDGSVYIYREGDASPSPSEQQAQRQEEREGAHSSDGDRGGRQERGGSGVHDRQNSSSPQRVYGDVRMCSANDGKLWQDERCKEQEGDRRSSCGCNLGGLSGETHPGMPMPCAGNRPILSQRGGCCGRDSNGGGGVAAERNASIVGRASADRSSPKRRASQVATNSGERNNSAEVDMWGQFSGATPSGRGNDNSLNSGEVGTFDDCTPQPDGADCGKIPTARYPVPVPGASYSAKVGKGMQGRGWQDSTTARAGGQADDRTVEPSAKSRKTAARLRNMILDRQASANRSIREVFRHFDRRRCGYVNVAEMRDALVDLRIGLAPEEAKELHSIIALDGGDRLCFAEFVVFVTDPHHSELQEKVCRQAAEQLEALGRSSFSLDAAFRPAAVRMDEVGGGAASSSVGGGTRPEATRTEEQPQQQRQARGPQGTTTATRSNDRVIHLTGQADAEGLVDQQHGASSGDPGGGGSGGEKHDVSAAQFLEGLRSLGLNLSVSDAHRLILRFDVHGDGHLSTRRFVSMVESSHPWTRALTRLAHQEEADEEADACLRAHKKLGEWPRPVAQRPGAHGHGQALVVNADIVEMARYIGIRVSSDSSLLWIAADALAAPLPNGWVMHQGEEGRWFYHNELTGQSRWDHPLDPHFRQIYLEERFGRDAQGYSGRVLLGRELSPEALQQCATATAVGEARGDGAAEGRAISSSVQSGRPPVMLPPCRMRPNVADFPTDKALDNLRARRLNAGGSDVSGSTFAAATATTAAAAAAASAVARSAHGLHAGANPMTGSNSNRFNGSRGELWVDGRTGCSKGLPVGPAGPGRRRPVSASAVREGPVDRSLGRGAEAIEGTAAVRGGGCRGGRSGSIGALLPEGSRVGDPQRDQRVWNGGDGGGVATATKTTRRPSSAKAALQRSLSPVESDYPSCRHEHNDRGRGNRERSRADRAEQQRAESATRNARRSKLGSPTSPPIADDTWVMRGVGDSTYDAGAGGGRRGSGSGGGRGGVKPHRLREDDGARIVEPAPQGDFEGISTWPVDVQRGTEAQQYAPEEDERMWLRKRLADLCGKLDGVEALALEEKQQRRLQHQRHSTSTVDFVAEQPGAPNVQPRGLGRRGRGRSNSHEDEPPRQPVAFEQKDLRDGRRPPVGSMDDEEMLPCGDIGNTRPSSGGDRDNPTTNDTRESSSSSLRDQILELSDRMRYLEARLLRRRELSSSPTQPRDEKDYINCQGEASEQHLSPRQSHRYHRHGRQGGRGRGAVAASVLTPGTTVPAVAGQLFVPGVGPLHGGGRGGLRHGSQDDLAYHSPERMQCGKSLSKKSWPPSARSSTAAAGIGAILHAGSVRSGGSSNSGSSYGDPSHAFGAGKKMISTSPHFNRWEGRGDAAGARAVAEVGRRNSGGRVRDVERARSGARRGKSESRRRRGNPSGIVLI